MFLISNRLYLNLYRTHVQYMILEYIRLFLVQSFLVMFRKGGFFVFKIKDVI